MSVLDDYCPKGATAADWETVRPAVATLLDGVDERFARRARRPLASLAIFAIKAGHEVTPQVLLNETVLAMWAETVANTRSGATYRSTLRQLADIHQPARAAARQPLTRTRGCPPPYTHEQVERMLAHAAALSTEARRIDAAAFVLCGAGAGLDGRDLQRLPGTAVTQRPDGVVTVSVAGSRRPRTVAVLGRYGDRLVEVAARSEKLAAGRSLVGSDTKANGVTDRARGLFDGWGDELPTARRLRITWLATHLTAGTRLPVLLAHAGTDSLRVLEDVAAHLAGGVDLDDTAAEAARALP